MRNWIGVVAFLVFALDVHGVALTQADLEPFADGIIETVMEDEHVPGVVLGVVAADQVLLLKGYGLADIASSRAVDPNTTLFRPGSVSKLFTWIALMQLQAQGKVDFDADINTYLAGIEIPETFPQPITIKHLMTHTPGFEDLVINLFGHDATSMRPLRDLLHDDLPQRVRPVGTYPSYSNHGVGLAGLIVETVSGEPWEAYVENHILAPLAMAHTTMRQPVPESLAADLATGYDYQAGKYVAQGFEFVPLAPAGGSSATGADMVRLLRAFMGDGSVEGGRVLSPQANDEIRQVLFRPSPGNTGLLHGFYESSSHGQRIIGHGGDTIWFHSELMFLPGAQVGWFISTNGGNGPAVRAAFRREFLDRYFGRPVLAPVTFEPTPLENLAGEYAAIRHSHSDFTRLVQLLGAVNVSVSADGSQLALSGGGEVAYLTEVSPLTFKVDDTQELVSFALGDDGNASHLYLSSAPVVAMERLTGVAAPSFHLTLIAGVLAVFLVLLVAWPIQRFTRRFVLPASVARMRLFASGLAVTILVFLIAFAAALGGPNDIVFGMSPVLQAVLLIPYAIMLLSLITLVLCPRVLREDSVATVSKLGYVLVAAAGIGFTWFMFYWQLL